MKISKDLCQKGLVFVELAKHKEPLPKGSCTALLCSGPLPKGFEFLAMRAHLMVNTLPHEKCVAAGC